MSVAFTRRQHAIFAAAAAGKILKLTGEQFRYAFGIALSQSAGSCNFNGWCLDQKTTCRSGLQNGLMAAFYAHEGFKGPEEAFEGKWGFFNSYSSAANHDRQQKVSEKVGRQ